ncbi:MAG: hypothetical protein QMB62_09710 [Oscillospiraceae bacterium]
MAALGEAYYEELSPILETYGVKLLCCPDNPQIDTRLRSHIDLSVFHIGENKFLLSKSAVAASFANELRKFGADILVSEKSFAPEYPNDAALCALTISGKAFHNIKLTDAVIKSAFSESLHHVRQGYAKCAVCPVTDNAAISSDPGLIKAMREQGIEVLEIAAGFISLEGFEEGFIGGAAFKTAPNTLAFTGTLDKHPDINSSMNFIFRHGVSPIYLTDRPVFDIGSLIPILEE